MVKLDKSIKKLGILGAGQLGRMSGLAAANLGIQTFFYDISDDAPAFQISSKAFVGTWDDEAALKDFAGHVDVISYEFENVPVKTVEFLSQFKPVYPTAKLLDVCQHRIKEKTFLNEIGIETTKFASVHSAGDITRVLESWGHDTCILKTCRFGYDGKGQVFYRKNKDDPDLLWRKLGSDDVIIEAVIDFDYEVSVVVAADQLGTIKCYPVVLNDHKNHILHKTTAPAPIPQNIANKAQSYATTLAKEVSLIGVLALELFVTKSGDVLANEIAPRTHNSGHWSIDGAVTSQFENHVRAVCGLPLGSTDIVTPCEMINLIGDDVLDIEQYTKNPQAKLHIYGKEDVKPGRKMGHVTILKPTE